MTTKDLSKEVSKKLGFTCKDVEEVIRTTFDTIADNVAQGDYVKVSHFGTFDSITRKAHKGYNPLTGEEIDIKENRLPKFKPSAEFKMSLSK